MNNGPAASLPSAVSARSRLWLGVSLLLVLLQTFQTVCYPLGRDQATYCYIGQRLWEGKHLYLDLWDNKPPGIFFVYGLLVKVFGTAMWSVGVVEILWLLVISCLIFKFAEYYLGTAPAAIAVVLHATWRAWLGYWDAAQPENFLTLLLIVAYFFSNYSGSRRGVRDFFSGILFGAAFWLKYTAVVLIPLLLILPYLDFSPLDAGARLPHFTLPFSEWIKRAAVWTAAFAASVVAMLGYIRWVGAWPAMKQMQFEVLPRYNAMALERIRDYWQYAHYQIDKAPGWWSLLVVLIAVLVARRSHDLRSTLPVFVAAVLGTICAVLQTRLPSYAFETCFPFYAMLWGYLGVKVFQGFRSIARQCWGRGFRLATVLIWLLFANLLCWPLPDEIVQLKLNLDDLKTWWHDRDTFYSNYPWARPISHYDGQMHVIRYLSEKSAPHDGVFVWGTEPLIYFLAQRNPPTRFVTNLALISLWTPPAWRTELVRDLAAAPPRYIVVVRGDQVPISSFNLLDSAADLQQQFPALLAFVSAHYRVVDDYRDFVIYRYD